MDAQLVEPAHLAQSRTSAALRRQRQIAAVAAKLFDQDGFGLTSLQSVADAVGIHKSTLYHYFQSKDELLYMIHSEFIDALISAHEERQSHESDPQLLLRAIVHDMVRIIETHRGYVRVFFENYRDLGEPYKTLVGQRREEYEVAVTSLLSEVMGGSHEEHRLTMQALFGMCNWTYQWYEPGSGSRAEEVAETFWRILLGGVRSITADPAG